MMNFLRQETDNALETCIASILDIPIDAIPKLDTEYWFDILVNFLDGKGFSLVLVHDENDLTNFFSVAELDQLYYIAIGRSPRNPAERHAVISKNQKLAHDPHPFNEGLLTEEMYWAFKER